MRNNALYAWLERDLGLDRPRAPWVISITATLWTVQPERSVVRSEEDGVMSAIGCSSVRATCAVAQERPLLQNGRMGCARVDACVGRMNRTQQCAGHMTSCIWLYYVMAMT